MGDGVDSAWIGKNVATVPGFSQNRYGTLGEQAVVPASVLGEYPSNLGSEQAASIWMQYVTAYGALVHFGHLGTGDFVSIPAASSSVGLAAIQIVRDAGATAIAVTRTSAKRDELVALGAHHAIASQEEDYVQRIQEITGGKGVRLTFDPSADPSRRSWWRQPHPAAWCSNTGSFPANPHRFPCSTLCAKEWRCGGTCLAN